VLVPKILGEKSLLTSLPFCLLEKCKVVRDFSTSRKRGNFFGILLRKDICA
jgi:hypothetical protein